MVHTTTPPALSTANQQATSIGLLAPRSSTRLPWPEAQIVDQHAGDAVGRLEQVAVGPARVRREQRRAPTPAALDGAVEELGGAVEPLRVRGEFRQRVVAHHRPELARRERVLAEGIRGHPSFQSSRPIRMVSATSRSKSSRRLL